MEVEVTDTAPADSHVTEAPAPDAATPASDTATPAATPEADASEPVDVDDLLHHHPPPGQSQQVLDDGRALLAGRQDVFDIGPQRPVRGNLRQKELRINEAAP